MWCDFCIKPFRSHGIRQAVYLSLIDWTIIDVSKDCASLNGLNLNVI